MDKQAYQLYYSKIDLTIEIRKLKPSFDGIESSIPEFGIWNYNQNYKFSRDKAFLKYIAESMLEEWIEEAEDYANSVSQIKIKLK